MKISSSVNRNYVTVVLTILFVVFLGAVYFFIYIPGNERMLRQQRFRTLQNINANIHEKIKNSIALMDNLLEKEADTGYINYLNEQSGENFIISIPSSTVPRASGNSIPGAGYTIETNNESRQVVLRRYKVSLNANGDTTGSDQLSMRFSFEQFFASLLPDYVFDDYVIFNNGQPVYETLPFGKDLMDSVFEKDNKINFSAIKQYTISGVDYNLFLQPVSFIPGNEWAIAGLLSDRRYQLEKNQLPSNVVLLLVTIMLAIIVSLPWIKLYQTGNKDRLTITDGIASIAVSMLLMSLLFFCFFKYNTRFRPGYLTDSKEVLARQIHTAFKNEIDSIYQKLRFVDSTLASHSTFFKNQAGENNLPGSNLTAGNLDIGGFFKDNPGVRQVFWMDSSGNETVNWTSADKNAPLGNFKDRAYFKNIIGQKRLGTDANRRYFLDQVTSWTSGNFTSVLSTPSVIKGQAVAALSFTMKSLDNPVLAPGYQFALTDNNGRVLYHSDKRRNLNEDLVTEFSEKDKLRSALEARTADAFETSYFSRDFNVWVQPVSNLPFFLVVFSDLSYRETREMEIYSFTFSMLLLLFIFFILQLFIVFLVSSQRSFFKKQLYNTSWIAPKISSHQAYNQAILVNVFTIFMAVAFFSVSSFLTYVFILLFSVTLISYFLTRVFARQYKANVQADNSRFKIVTGRWLFVFLCLIDLVALKILDWSSIWLLLLYEGIIVLAAFFLYYQGATILSALFNANKKAREKIHLHWNYKRSFAFMALTRLVITSGIPVAFFYISAYNYEQNISIRYRQLQYANALLDRLDSAGLSKINTNREFDKGYYNDSVWMKDLFISDNGPRLIHSREDNITSKILDLFRINLTDLATREDRFSSPHATDSSFGFNPLLKDACKRDSATITYVKLGASDKYLAIKSASLNYKVPSIKGSRWLNGFLFWTCFVVALATFYFIVYNIINKLFCLNLPDVSFWSELDNKIIRNPQSNNLLFIIGLPGSGKLKQITLAIKNQWIRDRDGQPLIFDGKNSESANVFVADLINIPDFGDEASRNATWQEFAEKYIFNEKNRLIIVNHFEYNIQDPVTNRIKLNFLERLMLENKCKIIILSTVHPLAFLDSAMDASLGLEKPVPAQDLERWHVLLGHYRIIVFPLRKKLVPKGVEYAYKSLYKETEHTHFLNKIQGSVLEVAKELDAEDHSLGSRLDELIFKVQGTAHYFYMYIWQSLTKEEKFLLYDLAEDNLVNSYDDYNLNMLLAKGVIIRKNGTLTLFNRGFRNFILTAIGNSELMMIKKRIKDNGNWSRLKTPLLIVLIAIMTFLLASQKDAYSEVMAYIAALGAGIPAVLKLFSMFNKSDQKE